MTFWVNLLFVFLIVLPFFMKGVLVVYLIDEVLKYEVRHKIAVYISLASTGIAFGVFETIVNVSTDGHDVIIRKAETLIVYAIMIIILAISLKTKWWKKIVVSFLAVTILTSVEDIFDILCDQIIGSINWDLELAQVLMIIFFRVLILFLEFGFLYLLKRLRSRNDNTPLPVSVALVISVLLIVFVSMVPDLMDDADSVDVKKVATVLGMLVILVFMALYFYIRVTRKERDDLKEMNHVNEELVASQTKFFESSARSDNEIRAMRHDMKNNIQVLKLLLENGEYEKMHDYLDEMGDNLENADISAHTGSTIADAIIADKTMEAAKYGLTLKSSGTISGIDISPVDMCKILANLLDNAIEAASVPELSELDGSVRVIRLQFRKTDNFFMISVVNPCFTAPNIENGKIVTMKKDNKNHGFGIYNIESASENYGGELSVDCEERPYGFEVRAEVVFPISSDDWQESSQI